jgi:DNA-binding PucR family transcriptional regulator
LNYNNGGFLERKYAVLMNDPFRTSFESLDEFADVVSEVLQCPITIEDANHRLLAYSTHEDCTDAARIATIIGRRVPEKVINSLWKEGIIPALLNSKNPVRVAQLSDTDFGDRVAVSIWKNEEVLGFIWALEIDKKLDEEDLALLKKAAEATKNQLLQVQTRKNKKEERYQEFFWKLLTSHFKMNDDINNQFQILQISPPSQFVIVVFQFSKDISREQEKQIDYVLKPVHLPKIILNTIDHYQLILLISLDQIEHPMQTLNKLSELFVGKMNERFGVERIVTGISGVHRDFQKVEKAHKEALTVLSIKGKFPTEVKEILSYQSLGIYQYIHLLLDKKVKDEYENYSLKKLHEYDQKYHSDLVETLEVFLNKDSNVNEAAKVLNVHVNTLNYRLKRISEIGEINLKDVNQKLTLFLDLKVEKFL